MADFDWDKDSAPAQSGGFDWERDAAPLDDEPRMGSGSSAGGAALRGFGQGLTADFGDEIGAGFQAGLQGLANNLPEGALDWAGIDNRYQQDTLDTYRQAREENRAQLAADQREHATASTLGNVAGGVVLNTIAPGEGTYAQAAALGGLAGLGGSEGDLTRGSAKDVGEAVSDTLTGTAFGLTGKALGDVVASRTGAVRDWVLRRAGVGRQAARESAEAMAERDVGQVINSLRGEAGGAASRAANVISNIDDIDLPTNAPRRTVGELKDAIASQMQTLREAISDARAKAVAAGINPDDMGVGRAGEFLAKGSRFDAAQKAAARIPSYEAALDDLGQQLAGLAKRGADEVLPDTAQQIRQAQAALRQDPRFLDLKQNVLKNSLNDFDEAAAAAVGRREAYQQALSAKPEAVASRADSLLSGKAAREQVQQRLQRYGAPLVGTLFGAGAGAIFGVATGADAGEAALYALGGAGARPALRSFKNLVQSPAFRNAAWSSLETLARTAPESFGRWSQSVSQALARGPEALSALDKVLRDTDPEWRQLREQQQKDARN